MRKAELFLALPFAEIVLPSLFEGISRDIGLGGTFLDSAFFFSCDNRVTHQIFGKLSDTAHEIAVVANLRCALSDAVGDGTAFIGQMILDTGIAPVNDNRWS